MTSSFKIKTDKKNNLSNKYIKTVDYISYSENLFVSKTFWIYFTYLFLSITLLTGLHMYEYFKCLLC